MHYLVTGGSGFIGRQLCHSLIIGKHEVTVLSRNAAVARSALPNAVRIVEDLDALQGMSIDAVINLAGANLAEGRWTDARKKIIVSSRVDTTRRLVDWIVSAVSPPRVLVSGSAIGWYGSSHDAPEVDESQPAGSDFPATICVQWEREAQRAASARTRVCCVRTGVVLGNDGGALKKMMTPFKLGLGGELGDGNQWMSWVALSDIARLFQWCAETDDARGIYNGCSPYPVTNAEFTKTLASIVNRPAFLRVPAIALRMALGEMAEMLLDGQRVIPTRTMQDGFSFEFPRLQAALQQIVNQT
jgi:uncharacterized protein (TIGR01777 family)